MSDLLVTIEAGTILILETGEYSDQAWHGPLLVVRSFIKSEVAEEFFVHWKSIRPKNLEDWEDNDPSPEYFIPWLQRSGYIEPIDKTTSWHIGGYGRFEPS